jgi:hypothetical protein
MKGKDKKGKVKKEIFDKVKEVVEEMSNIPLKANGPIGAQVPTNNNSSTNHGGIDEEYVNMEPNTDSVPPSHVTGETADEDNDKSE